jgi:hypothetical protein
MLFINNVDAIKVIIEARQQTDREQSTTMRDVERTTESNRRVSNTRSPLLRLIPRATAI